MSAVAKTAAPVLPAHDASELEWLMFPPVIDLVHPAKLEELRGSACKGLSDAEIGRMLNLAVRYGLDPFARGEIWSRRGASFDGDDGAVLFIVGRDGLRKIALRRGYHIFGDVVRDGDDFQADHRLDGSLEVSHRYSDTEGDRGPIVGAWAQVRDAKTHESVGYYFAPMAEHKPAEPEVDGFWEKTPSIAIISAAERNAVRRIVPLSGLLVEGEDETVRALATGATPPRDTTPDLDFIGSEDTRRAWMEFILAEREKDSLAWGPAEIDMQIRGRGPRELRALLEHHKSRAARPPRAS